MSALPIRTASLVADLESQLGGGDVFAWLEEQAEALAAKGASADGRVHFGVGMRREFRVKLISAGAITSRAELKADGSTYSVLFNAKYSPAARRFAIAHEFGHVLLDGATSGPHRHVRASNDSGSRALEILCDYFAGALLVPRHSLLAMLDADSLAQSRPALSFVPDIAARFHVQQRVAAWRLLLVTGMTNWVVIRAQLRGAGGGPLLEPKTEAAWRSAWYVVGDVMRKREPVKGYDVPFATHRRIPAEMVPPGAEPAATLTLLDARWWDGARAQPSDDSKRPLRARRSQDRMVGYTALVGDSLFVALQDE